MRVRSLVKGIAGSLFSTARVRRATQQPGWTLAGRMNGDKPRNRLGASLVARPGGRDSSRPLPGELAGPWGGTRLGTEAGAASQTNFVANLEQAEVVRAVATGREDGRAEHPVGRL